MGWLRSSFRWLIAVDVNLTFDQRLQRWVNVAAAVGIVATAITWVIGWATNLPWFVGLLTGLVAWVVVLNGFVILGSRLRGEIPSGTPTGSEPEGATSPTAPLDVNSSRRDAELQQLNTQLEAAKQDREELKQANEELRRENEELVAEADLVSAWDDPEFKFTVRNNERFRHERVPLDGFLYTNCTFENVTFVYKGEQPYGLVAFKIIGEDTTVETEGMSLWAFSRLLHILGYINREVDKADELRPDARILRIENGQVDIFESVDEERERLKAENEQLTAEEDKSHDRLQNKEEERNRQEELKGLTRIVDGEMSRNENLLRQAISVDLAITSGASNAPILALNSLETTDWNNNKVRIARLADSEHFTKLDAYYGKARDLAVQVQRLRDQPTVNQGQLMEVQESAEKCKTTSDEARQESSGLLQS